MRNATNNYELLIKLSSSFPEVTEEPHFEKTSFRVRKKIFVTYDQAKNQACVKLSVVDQNVFSTISEGAVFSVPNKWGQQGWTLIELDKVNSDILKDALITAYCEVAPKKLTDLLRNF